MHICEHLIYSISHPHLFGGDSHNLIDAPLYTIGEL